MSIVAVKERVRQRDGYRCTQCGMTEAEHRAKYGRTLDVHRVVPRSRYTVVGSVTLCRACHGPQPKAQPETPDEAGRGSPLGIWIDAALRDAIEAARKRNRRTLREEVSLALEQYLERLGVWPPPESTP